MVDFLNKNKFKTWLQDPRFPLLISGIHGIGKTHAITKILSDCGKHYTFIQSAIPRITNILELIHNKSNVYIIDDCDTFDLKEVLEIKKSILAVSKLCILISEPVFAQFIEEGCIHFQVKQVSFTTFNRLVKNKTYDRIFYDNHFNGDIRQIMLQSKVIKNGTDNNLSKYNFFEKSNDVRAQSNIKDFSSLINIMFESYIYNQPSIEFLEKLSNSVVKTTNSEMNKWINLFYPMSSIQIKDPIYANKHWTRMSNIKYRKKMFQTIRRSINHTYIGFESYYKVIHLRNSILHMIKCKKIRDIVKMLDELRVSPKMVNYFPKLQCNDEYTCYTTRLKPLFSYLRNK